MIDVVDWKLIGACNLRCLHCYGPPKNSLSLPQPKLISLADRFSQLGAQWIVLTGGEPLLVPGIDLLLAHIYGKGVKIALSTNTTYFKKHQASIERYVSSLNIPLDGSTPELHAKSRRDQGSYHTLFDILRYYLKNPTKKPELIRIGTVFSNANRGDFINMARVLEPYSSVIDTWKIYELMDYEFQQEKRAQILHEHGAFEREMRTLQQNTLLSSKISLAPANSRNKAYFMVNPAGIVVMPTDRNGVTFEIPLGDLLREPLGLIVERWAKHVDTQHYTPNHKHYSKGITHQQQRGVEDDISYSSTGTASCRKDSLTP